jgi:para-aminobenzoate synthetase/4-amino-4-deoxychorismate lyase
LYTLPASREARRARQKPMLDLLRPDPARGVFATLLVVDGVPVELDAQLARLRASVRELYGAELPASAAELAVEQAHGLALGRLRLTVAPGPADVRCVAAAEPVDRAIVLPGWACALDLRGVTVAGWRGAHKWADRRPLERLDARVEPAGALLVDPAGGVLETSRANVFALGADGVLRTPPADGSILPGIARALVIALAREAGVAVREEPLATADLIAAPEVLATGAVRGIEPVRTLDGIALGSAGELTAALRDGLRRRWLAPAPAASRGGC